nr:ABC transporter C family member 13 [Tanacetum cinerariifolium]
MLGFGASMITFVIIAVLAITKRTTRGRTLQIHLTEKVFLFGLPVIGAFIACLDLIMLLRNGRTGLYHEWLVRCSQLLVWAVISTRRLSKFLSCVEHEPRHGETQNSPFNSSGEEMDIIMKDATYAWSSSDQEVKVPILDRVNLAIPKGSLVAVIGEVGSGKSSLLNSVIGEMKLIKGSLYSSESVAYVPQVKELNNICSSAPGVLGRFWNLMTFKSINPVMEHGSKKQLDFNDLLELPTDMDPPFCHHSLLNCWEDRRRENFSHPSLFWTICYAYGWPYMCLGLLKQME